MTDQRDIDTMVDMLENFEQELCCIMGDEMDKCEAYMEREGISGTVYPEDAAPEIDNAIHHLRDAVLALRDYDPSANDFDEDDDNGE